MSVRKIRNSWWVDLRWKGERYRKRAPLNSRHGAEDYELTLRSRLNRGEPVDGSELEQTVVPTFAEFAKVWFETYVKVNNKSSEQGQKSSILRNHLVPYFESYKLTQITTMSIERYKAKKLAEGLAAKTVNNQLMVLKKALTCAEEWGLLERSPRIRQLKTTSERLDFLSEDEVAHLLSDTFEPRWNLLTRIALRTGMRVGEVLALDWGDVDVDRRLVAVRQSYSHGFLSSPKNYRVRHLPLVGDLLEAISPFRHSAGLVHSDRGRLIGYDSALRALHRSCDRAGIRRVGWHTLRHTFASHLVARGVSLRAVQLLLGHASILTTQRYAHLGADHLAEAVAVLGKPSLGNRWATLAPNVGPYPQPKSSATMVVVSETP